MDEGKVQPALDFGSDQDVVGVAVGDDESSPCLIGGFQRLSTIVPNYAAYKMLDDGCVVSVDMVRIKLSFSDATYRKIRYKAELIQCDEMACWTSRIRPGGWHELYNYKLGASSVALGLGFFNKSMKLDTHKGFIEFNPNKVAGDKRFVKLLDAVGDASWRSTLARFDVAMDVPKSRDTCRVSKDRRMYQCVISNGVTEYLGQKNHPGYVKVYDKAAEMGKPGQPLTRVELTCDGKWGAAKIQEQWPSVHAWEVPDASRDWLRVVGLLLAEKAERGEEVETYVNGLNWRTQTKLRAALEASHVLLPEDAAQWAVDEATRYAAMCGKRFE